MNNNKIVKLLGMGLLTLTLIVGCTTSGSSSEPSSSEPVSSEVSSETSSESSSEVSSESSSEVSSESSSEVSSESSSESSSENPVVEGYSIKIGEETIQLTKESETVYSVVLESVTKNTEIKFYLNGKERFPSCTELGNNLILNSSFDTVVHNDASNVKLNLFVAENGISAYLEGYQKAVVSEFSATINGESATLTAKDVGTGEVAKFSITLAIDDKLVVLGDGEALYIGENAMHFESEYTAPLPGEYIISINEYNRITITEPVLDVEDLYLVYINEELVEPTFVTPNNSNDKAEFYFALNKGDEFRVAYIDGTTLGSGIAYYPFTNRVYINNEGNYFASSENAVVNITAKVDGEDLTLQPKSPGGDLGVFVIEVEANQVIEFFLNGDPVTYKDTSETSFSYEEGGQYKIYVNTSLQVWDEPFVPATYREVVVSGVDAALISNRNIYTWSWETGKEGLWVEESPKVNNDGTLTVYLPETYDNFLLITTYLDRTPDWNNVKSQTNDISVPFGTTTATVSWKTQEAVSGGTTPTPTSDYVIKGDFDEGNGWAADIPMTQVTNGIYAGTITVSGTGCELKVKSATENLWYPSSNVVVSGEGTYKVTFKVSDYSVTVEKVS